MPLVRGLLAFSLLVGICASLASGCGEAKKAAARRGELRLSLPIGYVYDLDGQVGSQITESFRDLLAGKATLCHESDVREADIAAGQPEAGTRIEEVSKPPFFDERAEGCREAQ